MGFNFFWGGAWHIFEFAHLGGSPTLPLEILVLWALIKAFFVIEPFSRKLGSKFFGAWHFFEFAHLGGSLPLPDPWRFWP